MPVQPARDRDGPPRLRHAVRRGDPAWAGDAATLFPRAGLGRMGQQPGLDRRVEHGQRARTAVGQRPAPAKSALLPGR